MVAFTIITGAFLMFLGIIGSAVYSGFPWFAIIGLVITFIGLYISIDDDD